ncbi:hypothetical protein [Melissospora conviva]|uniref:hypothetical protein n=1 Tax=Melissospora conviva TaxID=3388432 RepID=UPI003C22C160
MSHENAADDKNTAARLGIAAVLAFAVILTFTGEYELARKSNYGQYLAIFFPLVLDVYSIVAFHLGRAKDVIIGLLLMIGCQITVHLLPVFIDYDKGEQTPWGVIVAVVCIPPILLWRTHNMGRKTSREEETEAALAAKAEEIRKLRSAAVEADRKIRQAEAEAARQAEEAEAARQAEAEARAAAEAEAAALAEARKAEEAARAEAEVEAEAANARAEEAKTAARQARAEAAEQSEIAQHLSGQLNELRTMADRAAAKHALAEQHLNAREQELHDQAEELDRLRDTVERQQRQIASGKAPRKVRATVPAQRAETLPVLDAEEVPFDLPEVPGVGPETVKAVLAAALHFRKEGRAATQPEIAAAADVSDKTVRNVRAGLPADHWFRIPGKLPAELTAG